MNKEKTIKLVKNGAAVIVIIAMLVIIFYQNRDRDLFKFGKNESSDVVSPSQNSSNGYFTGDVQKSGDDIIYINTSNLNLINEDGDRQKTSLALSNPVMHTREEFSVVYNKDTPDVTVFKKTKKFYSVKSKNTILCAKVNRNGYILLVTEKEGYNCECMVYNKRGEPIFKWSISKSEFIDGDINDNNSAIALSLTSAKENKLLGEIVLLDITQAKELSRKAFGGQVFYKLSFNYSNSFAALGSKALKYFNSDGSEKWDYTFEKDNLVKADISNPDIMVLAFEQSGSGVKGNSTKVNVINRLGRQIGSESYDYIVDDISVGENAVALAFGKTVYISDTDLDLRKKLISDSSVKKIALFNSGTQVFVISGSGGKLLS